MKELQFTGLEWILDTVNFHLADTHFLIRKRAENDVHRNEENKTGTYPSCTLLLWLVKSQDIL